MKIRNKLLLDSVMGIIIIIIMQYDFTGGLLHEIIGFILIVAYLFHVLVNHKYFASCMKLLKVKTNRFKNMIKLILNIVLIISTIVMVVTSVLISKDVLSFLNLSLSNYILWRTIHVVCAYIMVLGILAHVCFHLNMILIFIRRALHVTSGERVWQGTSRVLAFILVVFVFKTSVENVADSINLLNSSYAYNKSYISEYVYNDSSSYSESESSDQLINQSSNQSLKESTEKETAVEEQSMVQSANGDLTDSNASIETTSSSETKISQEEYLSKLFCTGCSKHCCLLAPQCSKGRVQQSNAISTYNQM